MGYPMTYDRVVSRNMLRGGYGDGTSWSTIAGDLRRLEANTLDPLHLAGYAKLASVTPEQVAVIFKAFFFNEPEHGTASLTMDEYGELYEALSWVQDIRKMERTF